MDLMGFVHGFGCWVEKHCLEPVFVHECGSLVEEWGLEPVFVHGLGSLSFPEKS